MEEINMQKFDLQRTVVTCGVGEIIERNSDNHEKLMTLLYCFSQGDFGTLCKEDVRQNNDSIKHNYGMVMGIFELDGTTIWIITYLGEGGYTTVLLPSEY